MLFMTDFFLYHRMPFAPVFPHLSSYRKGGHIFIKIQITSSKNVFTVVMYLWVISLLVGTRLSLSAFCGTILFDAYSVPDIVRTFQVLFYLFIIRKVPLLLQFWQRSWGFKKLNNLPAISLLANGKFSACIQVCLILGAHSPNYLASVSQFLICDDWQ